MNCRCGHGRHHHRATANAVSKRRRHGNRTPALAGCRYGAVNGGRKVCPCRNYVPAAPAGKDA